MEGIDATPHAPTSSRTDRRTVLLGGAALTAGAWVAPSIISTPAASAATCFIVAPDPPISGADIEPFPSGASDAYRNDAFAFIWQEQDEPITLAADLAVDATTNGSWTLANTPGATIPAGTLLFSFYVHYRPASANSLYQSGSFTIPAGYSFGGIAFRATGTATACVGAGTLRSTNAFANPNVTYTYCSTDGQGYEDALYSTNPEPPPQEWAALTPPVVRDTVVVSGGPGPGTPTVVTWYCFTGFVNSDDFRLFIIPEGC